MPNNELVLLELAVRGDDIAFEALIGPLVEPAFELQVHHCLSQLLVYPRRHYL
jgi:hypothetical protein